MFNIIENTDFINEELEIQNLLKETDESEETGKQTTGEMQLEFSKEIQNLSSAELRELASSEYAEHGKTSLRDAYLKLAETKENAAKHSDISFGSGRFMGKTAEQWLAEEKIAEIEGKHYSANLARENAKKAAQNDLK